MVVRLANENDVKAVATLFDRYRQFYRQHSNLAGSTAFIRARQAQGDSVILVASMEVRRLVGFVQLYPSFSSVRMAKGWILNDLFVDARWRGQGVGEKLMIAARDFAVQDGAAALWLATEKSNATAKRLYERVGYVLDEDFDHYELNLP
ncbi:MAG: GNAT family N-acetyltransferase [Bacteroidota bacterium]|nr:GNAT family N-acetyltransferase [Bacteroidota bacterium]MDE2835412.1 GNAT family N-acetyltransferase [Bacteroidota bacterium]MDE2955770.1 GNAT family N-acetyltransferase [Bacteroidota bacterium]